MSTQTRARKLTVTAMLSTIAFILMYIEFPIPALIPSFVKLDISDLPELLAAFSLGPVYGVVVSLLKNVLFPCCTALRRHMWARRSISSWERYSRFLPDSSIKIQIPQGCADRRTCRRGADVRIVRAAELFHCLSRICETL